MLLLTNLCYLYLVVITTGMGNLLLVTTEAKELLIYFKIWLLALCYEFVNFMLT